jgi:uncharacterized protein (TIGR02147 family)
MTSPSPFLFDSYKEVMKERLRGSGNRGLLSRAAEELNCQRSFLSRVMNSKVNLTPALAYKLAVFLKFAVKEREYFQLLVEKERAADPAYRRHIETRLRDMKREHESLSERSQRPVVSSVHDLTYFSSWLWTAIHFFTSIPDFQTRESIARRIGVPSRLVQQYLEGLEAWGFVKREGDRWIYVGGEFHVSKDSPLVVLHHQNWRQRAVMDSQLRDEQSLHLTNVHTIAAKDIPVLRELMLKFISDSNDLLRKSSEEEVVVVLCDFFKA